MPPPNKLEEIEVKGKKFTVFVDYDGMFWVKVNEEIVKRDTLKKLKDALAAIVGAQPLNIPAFLLEEDRIHRGGNSERLSIEKIVIISIHSTHDNFIYTHSGHRNEHRSWSGMILDEKTDTAKVKKLYAEYQKAQSAYDTYRNEHRLTVEDVKKNINVKGGEPESSRTKA